MYEACLSLTDGAHRGHRGQLWSSFIATGAPPHWPDFAIAANDTVLVLDVESSGGVRPREAYREQQCALWDSVAGAPAPAPAGGKLDHTGSQALKALTLEEPGAPKREGKELTRLAPARSRNGRGSLDCFVEHKSSRTNKTMCERAFHRFPAVAGVAACADACIADGTCVMFDWELQPGKGQPQCQISSSCNAPTNALAGYDGYFRKSSTGSCAPRPGPRPSGPGVPVAPDETAILLQPPLPFSTCINSETGERASAE